MLRDHLSTYVHTRASSVPRYVWNGLMMSLFAWIPGVVGIGVRAIAYRLILRARGLPAIETRVRLRRPEDITLGARVFLDSDVLLEGGRGGLAIDDDSMVMRGCTLQVYNHRALPHAGITLGRRTFVGEHTLMRGQGGITVGNNVMFGPGVQVLAVNHVTTDPHVPIRDQGITVEGIRIEDDCWIGAGAIVLDGVTIGRGACIGAGAVVTRSIPARTLAAGVPARVVRELDTAPQTAHAHDLKVHLGGLSEMGRRR
jgi:carbonic anhydrase/acetyltransferase-like protein (isoleucine patch superfamily)